mmetsp:Transcript_50098/g.117063  ORF Transcript_50098/g.117063 Transcript_50098/m.117063 type:complete len:385 (+) Transcript_50098:128-1282(+)
MDAFKMSKGLSWLLRHGAVEEGLQVSADGGVLVSEVLSHRTFRGLTVKDLEYLVKESDKKRFHLYTDDAGSLRIRAVQGWTGQVGHAIDDTVALTEICSKAEVEKLGCVCCHGTYLDAWSQIKVHGLKTMSRKHIHFACHAPAVGEVISGMRTTSEVLIFLDLDKFFAAGMKLFRSHNGVFLSNGHDGVIPPEIFSRAVQRKPTHGQLWPEVRTHIPGLAQTDNSTAAGMAQASKRQTQPRAEAKARAKVNTAAAHPKPDKGVNEMVSTVAVASETVPASALEPDERQRRLKKVKKSLEGVKKLEEKKAKGEALLKEEAEKVGKKAQFEQELQELEAAVLASTGWEGEPEAVPSVAVAGAKRWGATKSSSDVEPVLQNWEAACA